MHWTKLESGHKLIMWIEMRNISNAFVNLVRTKKDIVSMPIEINSSIAYNYVCDMS